MSEIPKISVIMSVFNGEKYLREAIDSVLRQSFRDLELIIINDASTDQTQEILESYPDPRIRVFTNIENTGPAGSLNKAISLSRGEYIAVLDADDVAMAKRLEESVFFLKKNEDVGLVGTSFCVIDGTGETLETRSVPVEDKAIRQALRTDNCFCHSSIMMRKKCVESIGCYRDGLDLSQDNDLYLRFSESFKLGGIDKPLCKWRLNPLSLCNTKPANLIRSGDLVRELSRERRERGHDRLEGLIGEEKKRLIDEAVFKSKPGDNRIAANYYIYWVRLFYLKGKYSEASRWLARSLKRDPFCRKAWPLVFKILVCWMLPSAFVDKIKKLVRTDIEGIV